MALGESLGLIVMLSLQSRSITLLQYFTIGAGEWRTLSHCSCLTESELGDAMWFTSIVQGITYAMTLIGELHLHRLSLNSLSIILTRQP